MATYYTNTYNSGVKKKIPVAGLQRVFVTHTVVTAMAQGTGDTLRVCKLPKGVRVIPKDSSFGSFDDPDSANNATASLKYTDGTTTKTIIATGNLQAADTPVEGTAATLYTNDFHVTDNDNYYVYLTVEANDVDAGADLGFVIAYELS